MKAHSKISFLIVDDEPLAREGLREILKSEKDFLNIGEAENGEEAVHKIVKRKPDIVFLDIQMPEMDGFQVLSAIPRKILPLVVFVTAYDEFAVKAFSTNALDYILKPMDMDRVRLSLHRVREIIQLKQSADYSEKAMEVLKSFQPQTKYAERITVRAKEKIYFVEVADIRRIEAAEDYIYVHTVHGKHIMRETMHGIEQLLDPSQFARVHRSHIVRIDFVKELQPMHHGDYIAILKDGVKLTISRKYKSIFQR
ncbi:MAG: LytTR family DNA-binding domain-containing protein [Ignavibacteriales bacterium]|nr:LytTR family DNA-binding domain-containing protein [Ignavibacteriales bacterium]